ncbi:hypothetical protein HGP28_16650 [Vibrio sp. SM6]|uniref:Queuosine biosynthesis protein QueD n=1 Tax=Vibrio agarilyticus TaxID=2726741 RepID=A0A7X8YHV7_9VIBR|nr:VC2046/SO_2500 family protein [Vibrio agarilyticus]NLS14498.1 hypothetical protein [Vibrio agarilyticus]
MSVNALEKATIINELRFGVSLSDAVQCGRRADFALLVSMFSNDARDTASTELIESHETTDATLRQQFGLSEPQALRSDERSYHRAAEHIRQFHQAGLPANKLSHYLTPDALTYLPEHTFDLPEALYHNLSSHERRSLANPKRETLPNTHLYTQLTTAYRHDQLRIQVT